MKFSPWCWRGLAYTTAGEIKQLVILTYHLRLTSFIKYHCRKKTNLNVIFICLIQPRPHFYPSKSILSNLSFEQSSFALLHVHKYSLLSIDPFVSLPMHLIEPILYSSTLYFPNMFRTLSKILTPNTNKFVLSTSTC